MVLLTVPEAAEIASVSDDTLRAWIADGTLHGCVFRLPPARGGRPIVRIDRERFADWLAGHLTRC